MRRMDFKTAHTLNALTSDFYGRCAASFAQTRTRPWHGWERCINAIPDALAKPELSVLDLGCGTLRFEGFLRANTRARLNIYGVDACPQLLAKDHDVHFIDMDIVSRLWDGTFRSCLHDVPECEMICAFGLMHHIPGTQARQALLDAMVEKTKPQGYLLISFWQFERDARLARKAARATHLALECYPDLQLDENDWLLGWQDEPDVLRYCHSFTEAEIDAFVSHIADRVQLIDRFNADGPNDDLNCYLVLRRI
ncbi:MAG: class I SAM-dependent methyltransferase [Coriobacteriia bacterium]|nr:MAG: class I SAM-dependent methyltransferase [Coriobacteriia bacterium]